MTREQAKDSFYCREAGDDGVALVDELYDDFEEQLSNLKHNYEMQEIVIADYKKCIAELEAPKSCPKCDTPLQTV